MTPVEVVEACLEYLRMAGAFDYGLDRDDARHGLTEIISQVTQPRFAGRLPRGATVQINLDPATIDRALERWLRDNALPQEIEEPRTPEWIDRHFPRTSAEYERLIRQAASCSRVNTADLPVYPNFRSVEEPRPSIPWWKRLFR